MYRKSLLNICKYNDFLLYAFTLYTKQGIMKKKRYTSLSNRKLTACLPVILWNWESAAKLFDFSFGCNQGHSPQVSTETYTVTLNCGSAPFSSSSTSYIKDDTTTVINMILYHTQKIHLCHSCIVVFFEILCTSLWAQSFFRLLQRANFLLCIKTKIALLPLSKNSSLGLYCGFRTFFFIEKLTSTWNSQLSSIITTHMPHTG